MSCRNAILAGIAAALGFGLVAMAIAPEVDANYSSTVKVPVHITISIPPTQPGPLPPPTDHSTEPVPSETSSTTPTPTATTSASPTPDTSTSTTPTPEVTMSHPEASASATTSASPSAATSSQGAKP